MNFSPTGNRVLIEKDEVEIKTAGGVYLPETHKKEAATQGKIVALGNEVENNIFKIGCKAMFIQSYEVVIEGKDYAVVNVDDILGVFDK